MVIALSRVILQSGKVYNEISGIELLHTSESVRVLLTVNLLCTAESGNVRHDYVLTAEAFITFSTCCFLKYHWVHTKVLPHNNQASTDS